VTIDEDGQHDPAQIPRMLRTAAEPSVSLVYAKPTTPLSTVCSALLPRYNSLPGLDSCRCQDSTPAIVLPHRAAYARVGGAIVKAAAGRDQLSVIIGSRVWAQRQGESLQYPEDQTNR
jgi:hypothetical protein